MSGTSTDPAGGKPEDDIERPSAVVFDVNETLSDMSPLAQRFADVGAPEHLAATWFASLLRDGFALTSAGVNPAFADIAADLLLAQLTGQVPDPRPGYNTSWPASPTCRPTLTSCRASATSPGWGSAC